VVRHDVDPQHPDLMISGPGDAANDATLVAVAQRDLQAFTALYERYADHVLNYCYHRLGTWSEAEDAAQQVFLNAFTALGRFRNREGSFRSWLFTVAHHEVANRRRGLRRHPTVTLTEADTLCDLGPTPEDHAIATDRQDRVRVLLSHLSDDQRRVLELRFAGLTDLEIATVLGRRPGAVRGVQARGVAHLRHLLGIRSVGTGTGTGAGDHHA
jgi:RNA polymerase sigma-70 factor (ECF subfamily)